jgi:hypothetical protein
MQPLGALENRSAAAEPVVVLLSREVIRADALPAVECGGLMLSESFLLLGIVSAYRLGHKDILIIAEYVHSACTNDQHLKPVARPAKPFNIQ